jgi:hypothetical protein
MMEDEMGWTNNIWDIRNAYKMLPGKSEGKPQLGEPINSIRKYNIKMDL